MTITARHALVTGGSRGIGRGISLKLAEQGVHVAINYLRDEASANATLEQVRAKGADGFIVTCSASGGIGVSVGSPSTAVLPTSWHSTYTCGALPCMRPSVTPE